MSEIPAADGEGVADDGPLGLAEEAEDLAQVVDQAGQDQPARMTVGPDRLGGLHQVLDLRQIGVGVAVIDQRVEELHRLPDAHQPVILLKILPLLFQDEVERLTAVIQAIKLAHRGPDRRRRNRGMRPSLAAQDTARGENLPTRPDLQAVGILSLPGALLTSLIPFCFFSPDEDLRGGRAILFSDEITHRLRAPVSFTGFEHRV